MSMQKDKRRSVMETLRGLFGRRKPRNVRHRAERKISSWRNPRVLGASAAGVVLISVLVGVWVWLHSPDTLPIKSVQISGEFRRVGLETVRDVVSPYVHKAGFIGVDMDAIQGAVEHVPWVHHAGVRRIWPDTLAVVVYEQTPVAAWAAGGLLNDEGRLFRPDPATYPAALPYLSGPAETEGMVAAVYRDMSKIIAPLGLGITQLMMDDRRSWQLVLDNGMRLVVGRNDAYARLLRFVRFYRPTLAPRAEAVERVDLRYTNGFAVRWKKDVRPTRKIS
jgi:cell division protein FtsQ